MARQKCVGPGGARASTGIAGMWQRCPRQANIAAHLDEGVLAAVLDLGVKVGLGELHGAGIRRRDKGAKQEKLGHVWC